MIPGNYIGFRHIIIQVKGLRFGIRHDRSIHKLLQNRAVKDYNDHIRYHRVLLSYMI
jgi:hypothetical protein